MEALLKKRDMLEWAFASALSRGDMTKAAHYMMRLYDVEYDLDVLFAV